MKSVVATLAAVLSLGPGQEGSGPPDRGSIAVLRRDGLMVPFASYRGTNWTSQWPQSIRGVELPINLESVPDRWWGGETPGGWQLWLPGGTTRELTPVAPQIYRVHCAERIGLRSNHKPQGAPPLLPVEPYPIDGLATTTGVRLEAIPRVSVLAPEWSRLAVALLEDFNRAEDRELSAISAFFLHPADRGQRRQMPVRLESWHLTRLDDGTAVSYIEAVRSYPPGPDDDECGLETLFSGWVIEGKGAERPQAELQARVTYCDRVGATTMQPFGRIRLRDRVYWVAQVAGREVEWYVVVEVASNLAGSRDSCR
jgi:hypothetical protein